MGVVRLGRGGIGVFSLLVIALGGATAHAQEVKPYVYVIFDTSLSMNDDSGCGAGSRVADAAGGGAGGRIWEAVPAMADVFAGVGEVTFALQGFFDYETCDNGGSCNC